MPIFLWVSYLSKLETSQTETKIPLGRFFKNKFLKNNAKKRKSSSVGRFSKNYTKSNLIMPKRIDSGFIFFIPFWKYWGTFVFYMKGNKFEKLKCIILLSRDFNHFVRFLSFASQARVAIFWLIFNFLSPRFMNFN